jgi:hypothetical protein
MLRRHRGLLVPIANCMQQSSDWDNVFITPPAQHPASLLAIAVWETLAQGRGRKSDRVDQPCFTSTSSARWPGALCALRGRVQTFCPTTRPMLRRTTNWPLHAGI